jgi:hypothetical protein
MKLISISSTLLAIDFLLFAYTLYSSRYSDPATQGLDKLAGIAGMIAVIILGGVVLLSAIYKSKVGTIIVLIIASIPLMYIGFYYVRKFIYWLFHT